MAVVSKDKKIDVLAEVAKRLARKGYETLEPQDGVLRGYSKGEQRLFANSDVVVEITVHYKSNLK